MPNHPDTLQRSVLPIPQRAYAGPIKYDAKDPESKFPPIQPLRPPAGAALRASFLHLFGSVVLSESGVC